MEQIGGYFTIFSILSPFLSFILLGISIVIGAYAVKHFPGSASNLVLIGVVIKCIHFLFAPNIAIFHHTTNGIKHGKLLYDCWFVWNIGSVLFPDWDFKYNEEGLSTKSS